MVEEGGEAETGREAKGGRRHGRVLVPAGPVFQGIHEKRGRGRRESVGLGDGTPGARKGHARGTPP